jgi:hypothetical protein
MTTKTPLALMKEQFGEKSKLVEALEKLTGDALWVSRTNKSKGLAHVSNAKLLRLHATFTAVKEKFGTRVKLIEAILEVEKRAKDEGYKTHLSAFPVPRLWDLYKSAAKRNAPKTEAGVKKAAVKKAAAKPTTKKAAPVKKAVSGNSAKSAKAKSKAAKKK